MRTSRGTNGVGFAISCVFSFAITYCSTATVVAQDSPATELTAARALEDAFVRCIEKAEQSVVAIARGRRGAGRELQQPTFVPHEYCAGVVVGENGLLLTNYHSLGKVDENDYVVWKQGKSFPAKVRAADPWSDLAILEIKDSGLKPIEFGDSAGLKKGRIFIALGNPHAIARDGNVSATWGIVSNISRKIDGPLQGGVDADTVDPRSRETLYHFGGLIQTDAKLAKGTSGGPMLDLDGKMIGLSTSIAVLAGFEKGTGYAIPVDARFRRVVEKLKRGEEIENGFLGVAPRNPFRDRGEVGVVLDRVEQGTPAAMDGLSVNDEIVQIDDQQVRTIDDLFFKVGSMPPGHTAQITVRSARRGFFDKKEVTLPVRLTKKPHTASRPIIAKVQQRYWRGVRVDYGTALSLKRISTLDPEGCVIVTDVKKDSAAWRAGLRIGSVISHVDDEGVTTPEQFYAAVAGAERDFGSEDAVSFTLFDRSGRIFIEVSPK